MDITITIKDSYRYLSNSLYINVYFCQINILKLVF